MTEHHYISDQEFLHAVNQDDDLKIGYKYKMVYPSVRKFILSNNGNEHDAKDIYQESFIVALKQIRNSKYLQKSSVGTYLYSISRRLWLKELKRRGINQLRINESQEFLVLESDTTDAEGTEKRFAAMSSSLSELGEPCQTIIKDFYLHKVGMEEIKEKMGYTNTSNAKNQKYKCLQRLKKIFFNQYKD